MDLFLSIVGIVALSTGEIQKGLDQSAASGKPFVLPAGVHEAATLHLRSGAHLRLASGAVLRMLPNNSDFAPVEKLPATIRADIETSRFEHALLLASDADRVTIDGPGKIDCARTGRGGPKPIALRHARNIKVDGITIDQAPNYAISMIDCAKVEIANVKILRAYSDGIDVDGSSDVSIHDVEVESFDDAICLKASDSLGKRLTTRNVTVERATLRTASVFFKLGTESFGDFVNIRARNLQMQGGMGNRHGNPGIALETVDGGTIRGVDISDVEMNDVGTPIFLRVGARTQAPGELNGVRLSRIRARATRHASVIAGLVDAPVRNVQLDQVEVEPVPVPSLDAAQLVRESRNAYPEPIQFGPIPASAFFFRHVSGLKITALKFTKPPTDPAVLLESVMGSFRGCKEVTSQRTACGDVFKK